MKQPLFKDLRVKFEKTAMETQLSDAPDNWQAEVASELHKQAPYVSNYAVDVVLDKVNEERGYGYGNATLKNKYELPQSEKDERSITIPILIKDRMLKPFDIYKSGDGWAPLTEQRISRALFRTQPLELTNRKPTDKMISPQMYPPTRSHVNAVVSTAGFGKYASLLNEVTKTITEGEIQDFLSKIASDETLKQAYLDNPAFRNGVNKIANANPKIEEEIPTVLQLKKLSSRKFLIKAANINNFNPTIQEVTTEEVAEQLGDSAYKLPPGSTVTIPTESRVDYEPIAKLASVNSFGTYKCIDNTGNSVFGNVLPVIEFDSEKIAGYLFINDSKFAIQEKIAAIKIANEIQVEESRPSGYGTFYIPEQGAVIPPLDIQYSSNKYDETYHGSNQFGQKVQITKHPLVKMASSIDEETFVIPESAKWISFPKAEISVTSSPKEVEKIAFSKNYGNIIEIRKSDDEYTFIGKPVEKLSSYERTNLNSDDAQFLLATMGILPDELDNVTNKVAYRIAGARHIDKKPLTKTAQKSNIAKLMLKEASVINDEETVDKVLSLGFIRPDNLRTFSGYLPELEKTTSKLSDLLFAARCGLTTMPEEAIQSALKNTDQIIDSLRGISEQENF